MDFKNDNKYDNTKAKLTTLLLNRQNQTLYRSNQNV